MGMFHVKLLFADTKISENYIENIFHIHPPSQSSQRAGREAKFFCDNVLASRPILRAGSP